MENNQPWKELGGRLKNIFDDQKNTPAGYELTELLEKFDAENIALAIEGLTTENAIQTFKAVPKEKAAGTLALIGPELAKKILKHLEPAELEYLINKMQPKDAAALLADAPKAQQKQMKKNEVDTKVIADAETRNLYPNNSSGRLMTPHFVRIKRGSTVGEAIEAIRKTDLEHKIPEDIFVADVDTETASPCTMYGVISIRHLLMHDDDELVDSLMETEVVSVNANSSQLDAAAMLSKYRFQSLPVVNNDNQLLGVIPVDDLLQVMIARLRSLYTKAVGTDARKMENMNSYQEAKLRVPWLLGTMAIELIAGLVIAKYDAILQKVILLASFMPVISAISGNVGLQAAAITVRAVDSKAPGGHNLLKSVRKELFTSLFMALVCGFVLGIVGAIWAKHIPFGLVIGGALLCSMITAGFMGTIIPIVSKRLGFDPATTAAPFETAFQDIIGFGVFLWLATVFQDWIV